jgi:tetratricopeptide (TPR) repeat protein
MRRIKDMRGGGIKGEGFTMRGHGLAPAYMSLKSHIEPDLIRLRELNEKKTKDGRLKRLTKKEKQEVAERLDRTRRRIMNELELQMAGKNQDHLRAHSPEERERSFEDDFGHPVPNYWGKNPEYIVAACTANNLAHNFLLSEAGLKVGSLEMPEHVVPTVKIGGERFVMEIPNYGRDKNKVPTLREYLRMLEKAHKNEKHPYNYLSDALIPTGEGKAEDFAALMKYRGGRESGLRSLYINWRIDNEARGNSRRVNEITQDAVLLNPRDPDAHYARGVVLFNDGHINEAVESFRKAVMYAPRDADSRKALARALLGTGRRKAAIRELNKALEIKETPNTHILLAEAHESLGHARKAKYHYSTALDLDLKSEGITQN